MDAKEFYAIYDSVTPKLFEPITEPPVGEKPITEAPGDAAPETGQVTPFPGQRPAIPTKPPPTPDELRARGKEIEAELEADLDKVEVPPVGEKPELAKEAKPGDLYKEQEEWAVKNRRLDNPPEELEGILDQVYYEEGKFLESDIEQLSPKAKKKIDKWLVDIDHPLAGEPGTQRNRIASIAKEIASERKAIAEQKTKAEAEAAKAKQRDIAEYKHLKDVDVNIEAIRGKTGEKVTVRYNAKKALEKIDSDIELLNKIVECL
jgi:hypothetical protein